MGQVIHSMSVEVVRVQSLCLLKRLALLGPGVRGAVQRHQLAEHLLLLRTIYEKEPKVPWSVTVQCVETDHIEVFIL